MDILKHTGYFHDGDLIAISHTSEGICITMESCVVSLDDVGKVDLSNHGTIKGKLHLQGIKKIKVGNREFCGQLEKLHDEGEILDLRIQSNKLSLLVESTDFPPKERATDVSKIEIEAEKVWWENVPNLENEYPD